MADNYTMADVQADVERRKAQPFSLPSPDYYAQKNPGEIPPDQAAFLKQFHKVSGNPAPDPQRQTAATLGEPAAPAAAGAAKWMPPASDYASVASNAAPWSPPASDYKDYVPPKPLTPNQKALAASMPERSSSDIPAFPGQQEEEDYQRRTTIDPSAVAAGTRAAAITFATEGAGQAIGAGIGALRGAKAARALQEATEQAAKINAAQDAAHIKAVAETVSPGSWSGTIGRRVTQFLKEDAEQAADTGQAGQTTQGWNANAGRAGPEPSPGGPRWDTPGKLPPAPQDVTAQQLLAKKAAEAVADKTTKNMMKDPKVWAALTGTALLTGGGMWAAMSTAWHARRVLENLSRVFGE